MNYQLAADFVVVAHLAFVLFVVGGALLILRWRWVVWLHLPAAVWGALIEFTGWICPLTPLESWLRIKGGQAGYSGGFVQEHVLSLVYPSGLTRTGQIALGVAVIAVNVLAYGLIVKRRIGKPSTQTSSFP